jgi:hypothetical protein
VLQLWLLGHACLSSPANGLLMGRVIYQSRQALSGHSFHSHHLPSTHICILWLEQSYNGHQLIPQLLHLITFHHHQLDPLDHIDLRMSTSVSTSSQPPRKISTPSRHRRSTISLHSTPDLGLIRTISRDLVTGWHATTALQKEPSTPPPSIDPPRGHKPRYAARDAMKGFVPVISCNTKQEERIDEASERARQYSIVPSPSEIDGSKPLGFVEDGLVPDHSFDTWTAVWDTAYESRVNTYHRASPSSLPSPATHSSSTISATERRKGSRTTRPPLSSHFSVTDAEVKAFVFGNREDRKRVHESPEAFLRPKIYRRGSEVPSLVSSLGSSEGSVLEDLEEEEEEREEAEDLGDMDFGKGQREMEVKRKAERMTIVHDIDVEVL